jgi:DNA-binding transcriptional MerR regulator
MAQQQTNVATKPAAAEASARVEPFCRPATAAASAGTFDDTPMTIGEVARQFSMTLRALRFYETKGLISPQRRGAMRFYRSSDRERLSLILTGRRMGFTLTEIADLLGKPTEAGLHLTREQCVAQINLLEQQKRGIEIAIAELRQICTGFYRKLLDGADGRSRRFTSPAPGAAHSRSGAGTRSLQTPNR